MIKCCVTCRNNKSSWGECLMVEYDPVNKWLTDNAEPWDSKNHCPENPKCDCPGYQAAPPDFKEGDYVIVINNIDSSNLLKLNDVWQAGKPRSHQPEEWYFKKITGSGLKPINEVSFFCSHFRKVTPVEMVELISSGIIPGTKELQMPIKKEPMKRFMVLAQCDIECYEQLSNVADALSAAEEAAKSNQADYYVVEVTHSVISKTETLSLK